MQDKILGLLAKTPRAGTVKTRMHPPLDERRCVLLARRMLVQILAQAVAHWPGEVVLFLWPDDNDRWVQNLAARFSVAIKIQVGDDLGSRMCNALRFGIDRGGAAVLGCDVPHCDAKILKDGYEILLQGKNFLGPAQDGGFYFLGMQRVHEKMFQKIDWEIDYVMDAFVRRAGVKFDMLSQLRDIDCYNDLIWLAGFDSGYKKFLR